MQLSHKTIIYHHLCNILNCEYDIKLALRDMKTATNTINFNILPKLENSIDHLSWPI